MKFEKTQVSNFEGAFRGMRNPLASWDKSDSYFGIVQDDTDPLDYVASSYDDNYDEDVANWLYHNGVLRGDASTFGVIEIAYIGKKDMNLAMRLCKAGPEHRKFLRQIQVCVDITAPIYWWKEFDTYKVGTVANSTSTMHKLASTPIDLGCFEIDDYNPNLILEAGVDDSGDTPTKYSYELKDFVETGGLSLYYEDNLIQFLETLRQKYNETGDKRYWKELVRWLPCGWLQTRTVTMNYENLHTICNQRANHKLTEWHQFVDWARTLPYAAQLIFTEEVICF